MNHFTLLLAVALPLSLFAAEENKGFIDPESAGPDFAAQGEYEGMDGGAQIIALGGGKFRAVGWENGLPGVTLDARKRAEVNGVRVGTKVIFEGDGWNATLEDGKIAGTSDEGVKFELKRIERTSPTMGAKPPEGAVILFDGTNADAWKNGRMDDRKFLFCGTTSKQSFGDCTLHLEFRTPFMPEARGQGRGNSGVYVQDRYECQILDSFGLKGENNETGGIYTVSKPILNMCLPPLSWQTYDIDFTSARFDADGKKTKNAMMTVKLNGVLVQDKVEVPHATTAAGRGEGADPGPIQLQNHGTPVFYRNIWVVEKK